MFPRYVFNIISRGHLTPPSNDSLHNENNNISLRVPSGWGALEKESKGPPRGSPNHHHPVWLINLKFGGGAFQRSPVAWCDLQRANLAWCPSRWLFVVVLRLY